MKAIDAASENKIPALPCLAKWVIVVFASFHGLILLISVAPVNLPPHSTLLPVLKPYHELTGTSQQWNMFYTIPQMHSMSATMKIEYPDGRVEEKGPLLPDMKVIRFPEKVRYFHVMLRIIHQERTSKYRDAWQAALAERMAQDGGRSFEVKIETQLIRHLFHIAKDGKLSKTLFDRFGTYGVSRQYY